MTNHYKKIDVTKEDLSLKEEMQKDKDALESSEENSKSNQKK